MAEAFPVSNGHPLRRRSGQILRSLSRSGPACDRRAPACNEGCRFVEKARLLFPILLLPSAAPPTWRRPFLTAHGLSIRAAQFRLPEEGTGLLPAAGPGPREGCLN